MRAGGEVCLLAWTVQESEAEGSCRVQDEVRVGIRAGGGAGS